MKFFIQMVIGKGMTVDFVADLAHINQLMQNLMNLNELLYRDGATDEVLGDFFPEVLKVEERIEWGTLIIRRIS
jgi:hypothetical protein